MIPQEQTRHCSCYLGPGLNLNCPQHGESVQAMASERARQAGLCGDASVVPYGYRICTLEPGHEKEHAGPVVRVDDPEKEAVR